MIMRYYWGFAIGHVYTRGSSQTSTRSPVQGVSLEENHTSELMDVDEVDSESNHEVMRPDNNGDISDGDNPELGLGNCEDDEWDLKDSDDSSTDAESNSEPEDNIF
jgi:hypothetical protein